MLNALKVKLEKSWLFGALPPKTQKSVGVVSNRLTLPTDLKLITLWKDGLTNPSVLQSVPSHSRSVFRLPHMLLPRRNPRLKREDKEHEKTIQLNHQSASHPKRVLLAFADDDQCDSLCHGTTESDKSRPGLRSDQLKCDFACQSNAVWSTANSSIE